MHRMVQAYLVAFPLIRHLSVGKSVLGAFITQKRVTGHVEESYREQNWKNLFTPASLRVRAFTFPKGRCLMSGNTTVHP